MKSLGWFIVWGRIAFRYTTLSWTVDRNQRSGSTFPRIGPLQSILNFIKE